MNESKFKEIPEAACRFYGGEVVFKDNGPDAKSGKVRIKARSGQPIEHWYWGRVVHDLAGVRHKPRIAIDYAHNDSEVLGYVNHFEAETNDLWLTGAMTPWRDDDRASEVMFKMREGVPYEASIFFGGDGIKLQEVAEGEVAPVNGFQFDGPGIIVREWPLRGVAICPYGADQNTEAVSLSGGKKFSAIIVGTENKEEGNMSEQPKAVEVEAVAEAQAVEAPAVETEAVNEMSETVVAEAEPVAVEAEPEPHPEQSEASATAERDALKANLDKAQTESAEFKGRAETAEAKLAAAEKEIAALTKRAVDAETKLAAMEKGAPPLSSTPAPKESEMTPWQKAVAKGRSKK
jgi:hypothetical protein